MSKVQLVPIAFKMSSLFVCFVLIHSTFGADSGSEILPEKAAASSAESSRNITLEISLTPNSTSIELGSTSTLTCKIDPEENGEEIWWSKDGTNIATSKMNNSNSTATATVQMNSEKDAGNYTCVVRTKDGNTGSKTVGLTSLPTTYELEINAMPESRTAIKGGEEIKLTCNIRPEDDGHQVLWMHNGKELTNSEIGRSTAITVVKMESEDDAGDYTCTATTKEARNRTPKKTIRITLIPEPGRIIEEHGDRAKFNTDGVLSCELAGFPLRDFTWRKIDDPGQSDLVAVASTSRGNATHINMTLKLENVAQKDNGTYECSANGFNGTIISGRCDLIVVDVPEVKPDFIRAVGRSRVYLNWTVTERNDNVTDYLVEYAKNGTENWESYSEKITGENCSLVVKGLEKSTGYQFRISARSSIGTSPPRSFSREITTPEKDPEFKVTVFAPTKLDDSRIEISWRTEPLEGLRDYVQYYKIKVTDGINTEEFTCPAEEANIYQFDNLSGEPSEYKFQVATYSNYTKEYGDFSEPTEYMHKTVDNGGTVIAGYPSAVELFSYFIFFTNSRVL